MASLTEDHLQNKKALFRLPTLSQYNTLALYDGSNIYKSVQSQ